MSALLLCWGSYCWACNLWVLIIYLFFLPIMLPSVLPRLGSESVSWCLETSLFLRLPSGGWSSVPTSFVSFFCLLYFSYLLLKTMGCFSGCLTSSAGIQKLFCGFYSAFKYSFDEFVGEKVVSLSYSSIFLGPPPAYLTSMQSTQFEMSDWMKHELESKLPGEISITSDMQMTPPLWQKVKRH